MRFWNEPPAEIVHGKPIQHWNVNKMIDCYQTEELLRKRTKLKRASKSVAWIVSVPVRSKVRFKRRCYCRPELNWSAYRLN